jgi:hypothetical protein
MFKGFIYRLLSPQNEIHIADNDNKLSACNVDLVNKEFKVIKNQNKNSAFELTEN